MTLYKSALLSGLLIVGWAFSTSALAQSSWYVGGELGTGLAPGVTMDGVSNDRSSLCDEFINPLYASVPGCTDPTRGSGDGWKAAFSGATGAIGSVSLGYYVMPWMRLEIQATSWSASYDDAVPVGSATGVNLEKLNDEIFIARERLGTFNAIGGFLNVYVDRPIGSAGWAFYGGAGAGIADMRATYSSLWVRNRDPDKIATGSDQPNAEEIRNNLAGTLSDGSATLTSTAPAIQFMVGLDRHWTRHLRSGLVIRYVKYFELDSDELQWDPLRTHVPNLRRDGSEEVHGFMKTSDFAAFSVGLVFMRRL